MSAILKATLIEAGRTQPMILLIVVIEAVVSVASQNSLTLTRIPGDNTHTTTRRHGIEQPCCNS